MASLLSARLAGTAVFVSQQGEVIRASDGQLLWKSPHWNRNDASCALPVVVGDVLYIPRYGYALLYVVDFTGCTGDAWKPKVRTIHSITAGVPREKGDRGDPWMAASPLIHDGLLYAIDIHSRYYVVDLKTARRVGFKNLGLPGESNYVALRIPASPTLVGRHIVVTDNQGHLCGPA